MSNNLKPNKNMIRPGNTGIMNQSVIESLTPTAQAKMMEVARKMGLGGLKEGQGTTRNVYDTLPLPGIAAGTMGIFEFFRNCNARQFPRTNITANKLEVGEIMVIEEMTFSILTFAANLLDVTDVTTIRAAARPSLYRSDLEIEVGNQTVLKPINLGNILPAFGNATFNATNELLRFKTFIVIPPQIEFIVRLKTTSMAALALNELCCTMAGAGGIFAPKNNF